VTLWPLKLAQTYSNTGYKLSENDRNSCWLPQENFN